MKYHKLIRFLDLEKIEYFKNHNLSKYNTMKINAISKVFVIVKSTDKLRRLLSFLSSLKMNYYLLGNGSNTLFVDKKIYKPIIKLEYNDDVFIHNGFMLVNASITNSKISNFLMRNGYSNFEFASVIPGTIGAGIALNSSYKNKSFSDNLMYVEVIDKKGNSHWLSKEMLKFSYRSSSILEKNLIVTRAIFRLEKDNKENIKKRMNEYFEIKKTTQPLSYPNLGSVFKNDVLKAYQYIQNVDMRGYKKGGAMISDIHSNFIINFNNATGKDVLFIVEKVRKKVYDRYKVNLILEITLVRGRK